MNIRPSDMPCGIDGQRLSGGWPATRRMWFPTDVQKPTREYRYASVHHRDLCSRVAADHGSNDPAVGRRHLRRPMATDGADDLAILRHYSTDYWRD